MVQQVKVLLFDVFGTVVDWRGGVIRDVTAAAGRAGVPVDAAQFADQWRGGYRPAMDLVRSGQLPWTKLDDLHRRVLDSLAAESGLAGLPAAELDWLNTCWHRLDPWPDSVPGLTRLRQRYVLATMSNGNVALLVNMARRAGLPWDVILSAELFRRYKPDPQTYLGAAELLSLDPAAADARRGAQRRPVRGRRPGPGHRVRAPPGRMGPGPADQPQPSPGLHGRRLGPDRPGHPASHLTRARRPQRRPAGPRPSPADPS